MVVFDVYTFVKPTKMNFKSVDFTLDKVYFNKPDFKVSEQNYPIGEVGEFQHCFVIINNFNRHLVSKLQSFHVFS